MGEISGTFIFNSFAQNGGTAKLWRAAGFSGTPPEQDDNEPSASYQQGSDVTTGVEHGGDGAFRFTSVPAGEYYISIEYDGHRAWLHAGQMPLLPLLTTEGDILVMGSTNLERLAAGTESQKLKIVGGVLAWSS